MMNRRGVIKSTLLLAIGLASGPVGAADDVKIGVQLPLTGERAPVGLTIRKAIEMAVEDVNGKGGGNGVTLSAVWEDSRDSAEGATEAVRKLVAQPRVVAIVGELFSPFALASRATVEQAGVPYLIGGTSPRTTEGAQWSFRVAASDALLADLLARYAAENLKGKKLAVLSSRVGVHNARADLLVRVLQERYGIAPVVRDTWKPDDRDFTSQLDKVKAASADSVIALGETGEGAAFLKQAAALPGHPRVIAHRDFGARSALEEAGAAAEGVLIVTEYMPALLDAERQAWAQAYQQRYGSEPSIIAAQHHDAVLILAEAMKRAGITRSQIKTGLEHLKGFRGVMADYTFDERRNGVHRFYVVRIRGGKPSLEAVLDERP
jgi:branched-chain amino acid transport system substrate-binding protein